jgi:hypothetical protein
VAIVVGWRSGICCALSEGYSNRVPKIDEWIVAQRINSRKLTVKMSVQ